MREDMPIDTEQEATQTSSSGDSLNAVHSEQASSQVITLVEGGIAVDLDGVAFARILKEFYFVQDGNDLILQGPGGEEIRIEGYFAQNPPLPLNFDGGKQLLPDFVDSVVMPMPGSELAVTPNTDEAIGIIQNMTGVVYVKRLNGTRERVEAGDSVYQGELVETDDGSSVKIKFIDDTIFSLGESARMAMDELVYDPNSEDGNTALTMLTGSFLFMSGKIAKTDPDDMQVVTPVATIGIRGTVVTGDVNEGEFNFTLVDGAIQITSAGSSQPFILSDNFTTISAVDNGSGIFSVDRIAETASEVIRRNIQQMSVLDTNDLETIEQMVEDSLTEDNGGEEIEINFTETVQQVIESIEIEETEEEEQEAAEDEADETEAVDVLETVTVEEPVEEAVEPVAVEEEVEEDEVEILDFAPEEEVVVEEEVLLDVTPPQPPVLSMNLNENGYLTLADTVISGSSELKAEVFVTLVGAISGNTVTYLLPEANENWTIDLAADEPTSGLVSDFAEGEAVTVTAIATDAAGNESDVSETQFLYDWTDPDEIADVTVTPSATDDTGAYISDQTLPTLNGTSEENADITIIIKHNGQESTYLIENTDGSWLIDLDEQIPDDGDKITLVDGQDFEIEVTQTDQAGNVSTVYSETYEATSKPLVSADFAVDANNLGNGNYIDDLDANGGLILTNPTPANVNLQSVTITLTHYQSDGTTQVSDPVTIPIVANGTGEWKYRFEDYNETDTQTGDKLKIEIIATDDLGNTTEPETVTYDFDFEAEPLSVAVNADDLDGSVINATPELSGEAEANAEIEIVITLSNGESATYITDADNDGNWTIDLDGISPDDSTTGFSMDDGLTADISVTATDAAGHSEKTTSQYTIDSEINAPTFSVAQEDVYNGTINATPYFSGTGDVGSVLSITLADGNNAVVYDVTVDSQGTWSLDTAITNPTSTALNDAQLSGAVTITYTAKDTVGNETPLATFGTYTVDSTADAVTLTADDVDSYGDTINATPTFTGTGEADSELYLTLTDTSSNGATLTYMVTTDSNGNWTLDIESAEDIDGNKHTLSGTIEITYTDAVGNEGASDLGTYTVDATADAVTLTADDVDSYGDTINATPTFTGIGEADSELYLTLTDTSSNGATLTYMVTTDSNGNWALDIESAEDIDGNKHTLSGTVEITYTDAVGNEGASDLGTYTVDSTADAVTLTADDVDSYGDTINATPTFTGIGEADSELYLTLTDTSSNGATLTYMVTTDSNGNWTLDIESAEDIDGNKHTLSGTIEITYTDAVGNEGASDLGTYTVDATADAVTLTADDVDSYTNSSNVTTVNEIPTFTGTGEADSELYLTLTDTSSNGATLTYMVTTDSNGNWALDIESAEDIDGNKHTLSGTVEITYTDAVGNEGASDLGTYTVDATADAVTLTADDVDSYGDTINATPTFTGIGEADSELYLTLTDTSSNGATLTYMVTTDSNGNWTLDIESAEDIDGNKHTLSGTIEITYTDAVGNEGASDLGTYTVDATADAVTLTADDVDSYTNSSNVTTVNEIPTFTGTGEADSELYLTLTDTSSNGATLTYMVTTDSNGNWTLDIESAEDIDGNKHTLSGTIEITYTDAVGNEGASDLGTYTVDATADAVTLTADDVDSYGDTINATPTFTGIGEVDSELYLTLTDTSSNGATLTYMVTTDSNGNWALDIESAEDIDGNKHTLSGTIEITYTDAVGNEGSSDLGTYTVDSTADAVTLTADDVDSYGDTINATPTFTGTGEADSELYLTLTDTSSNGVTLTYMVTTDNSGNWALDIESAEDIDGNKHNLSGAIQITYTDAVGNEGASDLGTYTVDATADAVTLTADDVDSYTNSSNVTTVNEIPTFTGTGEADSELYLTLTDTSSSNGATLTYMVTTDSNGNWTLDIDKAKDINNTSNVLSGTVKITYTDAVGNEGASDLGTYTVDNDADAPQGFDIIDSNGTSINATPILLGTVEAGSQSLSVTVVDFNNSSVLYVYDDVAVNDDGTWTLDFTSDVATDKQTHNLSSHDNIAFNYSLVDPVGNTTTGTLGTIYTVDDSVSAPTISVADGNGSTINATPTFEGSAEAGSTVLLTLTDNNGSYTYSAVADSSNGEWSIDVAGNDVNGGTNILSGNVSVGYSVTDLVGNTTDGTHGSYTVDSSADAVSLTVASDDVNGSTMNATPAFSGTGEANTDLYITLTDSGSPAVARVYKVTIDGSGNWDLDLGDSNTVDTAGSNSDLSGMTGAVEISYSLTDSVGNTTDGDHGSYTVDAVADTPSFDVALDDIDGSTINATPVFSGTAEADLTFEITLSDGSTSYVYEVTSDASGNWSLDVEHDTDTNGATQDLSSMSTVDVTYSLTDAVGNTGSGTLGSTYTVDAVADTPSFDVALDDIDGSTINATPVFSGTAEADLTFEITLSDGSTSYVYEVTSDASGNWSLDVEHDTDTNGATQDLSSMSTVDVTYSLTDAVGNTGSGTLGSTYTVDAVADTPSFDVALDDIDGSTINATPVFSGTAEADLTFEITLSDGSTSYVYEVTSDASGNWSLDVEHDTDTNGATQDLSFMSTVDVTYSLTDAVGNIGSGTLGSTYTVDGVADTPSFDVALDDIDGSTINATPVFSGTAEADLTFEITLSDGSTSYVYEVTSDASGNWSLDVEHDTDTNGATQDLSSMSTVDVTYSLTDAVGNTGSGTLGSTYTVDAVADTPSFDVALDDIDGSTINATPVFSGTAEADLTFEITLSDGSTSYVYEVTSDASGNWSLDVEHDTDTNGATQDLSSMSTVDVTYSLTDAVGNTGSGTLGSTYTVDAVADTPSFDVALDDIDGSTINATPVFSGTAEADLTFEITLSDGSTSYVYEVTSDASGNWSLDVEHDTDTNGATQDLSSMSTVDVTYSLTDAVGNTGSGTLGSTYTVDAVADTPSFDVALDDIDGSTINATPVFSGTAEADLTFEITLSDGSTSYVYEVTSDASGNWSLDVEHDTDTNGATQDLSSMSTVDVTYSLTDSVGNTGSGTLGSTYTVDAVADTPSFDVALDDIDGSTINATPVFSGTAEADLTFEITLSDGSTSYVYEVTSDASGNWSLDVEHDTDTNGATQDLSSMSTVDVTYSLTDAVGNTGSGTLGSTYTVDAVADTPSFDVALDDIDGSTINATPVFSGTAEADLTFEITLSDGSTSYVYEVTSDASGNWSLDVEHDTDTNGATQDLSSMSTVDVTYSLTDAVGNIGSGTLGSTYTVDGVADTPSFDVALDDIDGSTINATPVFSGTAEADLTFEITLSDGSTSYVYEVTSDASGNWSLDVEHDTDTNGATQDLSSMSTVDVTYSLTDAVGNTGSGTLGSTYTVDAVADTPSFDVALDDIDGSTINATPVFSGTAEADLTFEITLSDGSTSYVYEVTSDASGNWSLDVEHDTDTNGATQDLSSMSTVDVTYSLTDAVGNTGSGTLGSTYTVDAVADTPSFDVALDDIDGSTINATPVFSGTAEADLTFEITLSDGSTSYVYEVTSDASGNWSLDVEHDTDTNGATQDLSFMSTVDVTYSLTDAVGNIGSGTLGSTYTVDGVADTPSFDVALDDIDGSTINATPVFSGTAEADLTFEITLSDGSTSYVYEVTSDASGNWSLDVEHDTDTNGATQDLSSMSTVDVTYSLTDAVGNTGSGTLGSTYTVDAVADTPSFDVALDDIDGSTINATPVFSGTAEADLTFEITLSDGSTSYVYEVTSDASGNWSLDVEHDTDTNGATQDLSSMSTVDVTYSLTDAVGNIGSGTLGSTYTVDGVADTPSFDVALDDIDGSTINATPVFSGTAEADLTFEITLSDGSTSYVYEVTSDASGNWSLDVEHDTDTNGATQDLSSMSTVDVTYSLTDAVGNTGSGTLGSTYTVDAVADTPSFDVALDDIDGSTINATPVFSGTAEADLTFEITLSDGSTSYVYEVTSDASGNWSLDVEHDTDTNGATQDLSSMSTVDVTYSLTDAVGNTGSGTLGSTYTVDAVADTPSFDVALDDIDGSTINATPVFSGTAEADLTFEITLSDGSTSYVYEVTSDASGNWSLDVEHDTDTNGATQDLSSMSTVDVTYSLTDAVGNTGSGTLGSTYTVDAVADTPSFDVALDDIDGSTINATPVFSGTAEADLTFEITLSDGSTSYVYEVTSDASGNWSLDVEHDTDTNGATQDLSSMSTVDVTYSLTDAVGNTGSGTLGSTYTVDAVADTPSFDVALDDIDGSTINATPVFSGTAEADLTFEITLSDGSTSYVYEVTSDASGNWSLDVEHDTDTNGATQDLSSMSTVDVTYSLTDAVGNTGSGTLGSTYTVDAVADTPSFDVALDDIDGSTINATPVFSGTAEADLTFEITLSDGSTSYVYEVTSDASGNWSLDVEHDTDTNGATQDLSSMSTVDVTYSLTDAVGNIGSGTLGSTYTVDAVADTPTLTPLSWDENNFYNTFDSSNPTPLLTIDGEANSTVVLEVTSTAGGSETVTIDVHSGGKGYLFYKDLTASQNMFVHGATITYSAILTDAVGNVTTTAVVADTGMIDLTSAEVFDGTGDVDYQTLKADYLGPVNVDGTGATSSYNIDLTSYGDVLDIDVNAASEANLGDGDDLVNLYGDGTGTLEIDGEAGTDTLVSQINLDTSISHNGTNIELDFGSGGSVEITGIEELVLGSGNDDLTISDLANFDGIMIDLAGGAGDSLTLSAISSAISYDFDTGTLSDGTSTTTISGVELYYGSDSAADIVTVYGDEVLVTGGSDSTAPMDEVIIAANGHYTYKEPSTGYAYMLNDKTTHIHQFETITVNSGIFAFIDIYEESNIITDDDNASGNVLTIDAASDSALALNGLTSILDITGQNSTFTTHNDGSITIEITTQLKTLEISADAVSAAENVWMFDNYNHQGNFDLSTISWKDGLGRSQTIGLTQDSHVALGVFDSTETITVNSPTQTTTIASLTGESNLSINSDFEIKGDLFDYAGEITVMQNGSLTVGGTFDMHDESVVTIQYDGSNAAMDINEIDYAGTINVEVDFASINSAGSFTVIDADSYSGSLLSLNLENTSGGSNYDSTSGYVLNLEMNNDGDIMLVSESYDSSVHILGQTGAYEVDGDDELVMGDDSSVTTITLNSDKLGTVDYISGGLGAGDTLVLEGDGDLFVDLFNDELYKIANFETLDISALDASFELDLTAQMISAMSNDTQTTSGYNTLTIDGQSGQTLNLSGFSAGASSGGYTVYTKDDAEIYVDDDIVVNN